MNFLIHLIEDIIAKSTVRRFSTAAPEMERYVRGILLRPPKVNRLAGWLVMFGNAAILVLCYFTWSSLDVGGKLVVSVLFVGGFLAGFYILISSYTKYIVIGDMDFEYHTFFGNVYIIPYSEVIKMRQGSNFLHIYTFQRHCYVELSLGNLYRLTDRINGYAKQ